MLRSPAEYFIKYLLVHPDGLTDEQVKKRLVKLGLDYVSLSYLAELREELHPPKPFRPFDPMHRPSMTFILDERINHAFQRDVPMKMALEVLKDPRAKMFMESHLHQAPMPAQVFSDFLIHDCKIYCTVAGVGRYRHYFWNHTLLDRSQLQLVVGLRFEQFEHDEPALRGRSKLLRSTYFRDPRKLSTELPHSPISAMVVQVQQGMRPSRLDQLTLLKELQFGAAMRAYQAMQQDGLNDSQKCLNYTSVHKVATEALQMAERPEQTILAQMSSVALRTETQPIKKIEELSAGQHTADVAPTRDLDAVEEEQDELEPEPGEGDFDDEGGAED